ncbi:alpha/beta hydrolase [Kitasatospora sp. NPDC089509]|uniref:alpha/beta hydrolase n=1 Tax=Kitasatospora sp. NPDC089509 TaxID=3364079 RepID=UPI003818F784
MRQAQGAARLRPPRRRRPRRGTRALRRRPAGEADRRAPRQRRRPRGLRRRHARAQPRRVRRALHDRFDIIGFDPRGAAGTTPVNCLDDRARDDRLATDRPAADHAAVLAEACRAAYGKVLPHVGTRDTARDMDVLRGALRDDKLNYLGLSYGTYLGGLYAEQFPDRVGRLVLDGPLPSSATVTENNVELQAGLESALKAFAADCTNQASCPLGTDRGQAAQKLADFLDGLADHPLPASRGRTLTAALAWAAVLRELSGGSQTWAELYEPLNRAMTRGDGDDLLKLADVANGRGDQGRYGVSADAPTAIACADSATSSPTPDRLSTALADLAAKAPLVSKHGPEAAALDPDCRAWPFRSPEQPHAIRAASGSTPVLVVGSTADPLTPYAGAQRFTAELGNAVLLTRDGDGHTAYVHSNCIRAAVQAYLTEGLVPAAGTHCSSI